MNSILFLAEWAIRSSLLVMVAALLLRAFRVKDASTRLIAWVAVLFASLAIPALTVALPSMPLIVMRSAPPIGVSLPGATTPVTQVLPPLKTQSGQSGSGAHAAQAFDWTRAAFDVYVLVAAALLLRTLIGLVFSLRILRASRSTEMNNVRESDRVSAPVTVGILRPAVVLPADWRQWDPAKLDAVLAHER